MVPLAPWSPSKKRGAKGSAPDHKIARAPNGGLQTDKENIKADPAFARVEGGGHAGAGGGNVQMPVATMARVRKLAVVARTKAGKGDGGGDGGIAAILPLRFMQPRRR